MSVRTEVRRKAGQAARKAGLVPEVLRLEHLGDRDARRLAWAIHRPLTKSEQSWIDRIEQIRARSTELTEEVPDKPTEPRSVGVIARKASQAPESAAVLMKVVRAFRPRYGIEMGTCVGVSTGYQAAAMAMNGTGRLVSLEGYEVLSNVARKNLADLGLAGVAEVRQGKFNKTLEPAIAEAAPDYAFIDGHHQEEPTLRYYDAFTRAAKGPALLVFDDIDWSDGMRRAWDKIKADSRTTTAVALGRLGFCFVNGA